ncbi:MAG: diacylglycerol kinase family protein [Pirellulales bacterium]
MANPKAGMGRCEAAIRQLVTCLEAVHLAPVRVGDLNQLTELAANTHAQGRLRAIVAVGGDGTVAEIVNRTQPDMPITVLPHGTANLLARHFGLEADPETLAHVIRRGATIRLDAGRANGRIFVLMVGCGFDADVVHRMHQRRTAAGVTYWTYARPILEAIRSYRYPRLRVYCERETPTGRTTTKMVARWAFVINLPCYAGGLNLAPEAIATDGVLNVSTLRNGSIWYGLWYIGHVLSGRTASIADYRTATVTRVRIESREPVHYQLDGDPGGMLPLEVEVLPGRITLLHPAAGRTT